MYTKELTLDKVLTNETGWDGGFALLKYHRSCLELNLIMYFLNVFSFESSNCTCKWHLLFEVQTFNLTLQIYVIKLKKFEKDTQTKSIKIYEITPNQIHSNQKRPISENLEW